MDRTKMSLIGFVVITVLYVLLDGWRANVTYSSVSTASSAPVIDPETGETIDRTPNTDFTYVPKGTGLHIQLCTGCGYYAQFNKVKDEVEFEFPGLPISYSEYPTGTINTIISYTISILQYALIALQFFGEQIMQYTNNNPLARKAYDYMMEKRIIFGIGFWFVGNQVKSFLTNSGAFEVFLDGNQLYSKLVSGQFPDLSTLINVIKASLE